jgi:hypothetical protein
MELAPYLCRGRDSALRGDPAPFEGGAYAIEISFRGRGAALRLLLEGVKDVNDAREPDSVDGAVSVAVMVLYDLQHASAFERLVSCEGLGSRVLATGLRDEKCVTDLTLNLSRERLQIVK